MNGTLTITVTSKTGEKFQFNKTTEYNSSSLVDTIDNIFRQYSINRLQVTSVVFYPSPIVISRY